MSPADRYSSLVNSPIGGFIAANLGLPQPVELERFAADQPLIDGPVLIGSAPGGRIAEQVEITLGQAEVSVHRVASELAPNARFKGLVFDASGIKDSTQLRELWEFFSPVVRRLADCGRVVVLATPPEDCEEPRERTAQRALEGFTRALAKEARNGQTVQLIYVAEGAEPRIDSSLRFFCSPRSAYVSGQVVRIGSGPDFDAEEFNWEQPLAGKVALVTGASRGIGEAIARVLARDGAHVVGLDIPPLMADLERVTGEIGGSALACDITDSEAPDTICNHLKADHGGVDVVVHNAGVTKDKTLGGMDEPRWTVLMEINLSGEERINDELLARKLIRKNGRVICVSSISGIAGTAGQTNYSTSKAGVIGMVDSMAAAFAAKKVTINAVAPGFIETAMTAAIPIGMREAGRRMNSMRQGGLPVDVGETIAWYASPASGGLNGNVVRVCGQSLIGA